MLLAGGNLCESSSGSSSSIEMSTCVHSRKCKSKAMTVRSCSTVIEVTSLPVQPTAGPEIRKPLPQTPEGRRAAARTGRRTRLRGWPVAYLNFSRSFAFFQSASWPGVGMAKHYPFESREL